MVQSIEINNLDKLKKNQRLLSDFMLIKKARKEKN